MTGHTAITVTFLNSAVIFPCRMHASYSELSCSIVQYRLLLVSFLVIAAGLQISRLESCSRDASRFSF